MLYDEPLYRPPGEGQSLLIQATIGCSHNQCTFCGMYKGKRFRIRPLADILSDIDEAAYLPRFQKIFLCDGDAICMPQLDLLAILRRLKLRFPEARLISTYAGPRSTLAKTPEELHELREAGLGRAYLGIETGSDAILSSTRKGVNAQEMLQAGTRLREAGIDLWGIILIGLGGKEKSAEHIAATAEILNRMKPNHISAMNYMPVPGTKLYEDVASGRFTVLTPEESLVETRELLSQLTLRGCHFTSDHASNYLPLKGTIGEDTPKLLTLIDGALQGKVGIRGDRYRGL